jgi:hypothetical protein
MPDYDCTNDVIEHKTKVGYWLRRFAQRLERRAATHDDSKINDPIEKAMFDRWTPEIRNTTFGTDEYKQALDGMGEGVKRHYQANRHHPEHYENGVNGMTLIDVMEMLTDWMAVAQSKNTRVDLKHAAERFGLSDQLVRIMINTLREEDAWNKQDNIPIGSLGPEE